MAIERNGIEGRRREQRAAQLDGTGFRSGLVKIGVLDGEDLVREGLAALIDSADDFVCVGTWSDAGEAMRAMEHIHPDVLLVDVRLPEQAGFDILRNLPLASPGTRVIVTVNCREEQCVVLNPLATTPQPRPLRIMSQEFAEPDDCLQIALKLGAHGVLRKQCSFKHIAHAIRTVHSGQYWIELPTATRLAQQYLLSIRPNHAIEKAGADSLTLRERQVIGLISQGRSNKEISRELQIGYSTVKNYVSSILEKLELSDRTQIALYAVKSQAPESQAAESQAAESQASGS